MLSKQPFLSLCQWLGSFFNFWFLLSVLQRRFFLVRPLPLTVVMAVSGLIHSHHRENSCSCRCFFPCFLWKVVSLRLRLPETFQNRLRLPETFKNRLRLLETSMWHFHLIEKGFQPTIDLKQMFNTFPRLPESTIFAFLVAADSYTLQNMFEEWRDQRKNLPLRETMSLRYYQGPDAGLDVYWTIVFSFAAIPT